MVDVFISYARAESAEARRVKDLLEGMGLNVFFDVEGIDGGDVFPDVFDNAIKKAGVVLSLWSPLSLTRPWVKKECYIGQTRGVLLPVAIAPLNVPVDVPAVFMDTQFLDLTDFKGDPADPKWRKVVRSLARTLKRPDLLPKEGGDEHAAPHPAGDPSAALRAELKKMRADLDALRNPDDNESEAREAKDEKRIAPQPQPKPKPAPGPNPLKLLFDKLPPALRKPPALIGAAVGLMVVIAAAVFLLVPRGGPDALVAELKRISFQVSGFDSRALWTELHKKYSTADFEKAADHSAKAATLLAQAYYVALDDVPLNITKAKLLVQKACDDGEMGGCNGLGKMYSDMKEFSKSVPLFQKACAAKDMMACDYLGTAYNYGEGFDQPDIAKANEYYEMACKGGEMSGCMDRAVQYEYGAGTGANNSMGPPDVQKALPLLEQACTGKAWDACSELGQLYDGSQLMPTNYDKAFGYYTTACDNNDLLGCSRLGVMYATSRGTHTDFAKAKELFTKACDGNESEGCRTLGQMYLNGDGMKQKDAAQARRYFQAACDFMNSYACTSLGGVYMGSGLGAPDYAKSFESFFKACSMSDQKGCDGVAQLYWDKHTQKADMQKMMPIYERDCQRGTFPACTDLAIVLLNGDVVGTDTERAMELLKSTCDRGYPPACQIHAKAVAGQPITSPVGTGAAPASQSTSPFQAPPPASPFANTKPPGPTH